MWHVPGGGISLLFEFSVPDFLYDRELKRYGGELLIELRLRVEELSGAGACVSAAALWPETHAYSTYTRHG
jgi:hypothetical protein